MKKKLNLQKLTAVLLTASILLGTVYTGGTAAAEPESAATAPAEGAAQQSGGEPYIIGENTAKRTENEKHFYLSDGSMVAALYDTPVHYKDENGNYEPIDNSFSEGLTELETKSGPQKIKLAKKASAKKLVTLHYGDYQLSWGFEGANKSRAEVQPQPESTDPLAVKNVTSETLFKNAFEGADLQYIVSPLGVKENIILNANTAPHTFTQNYSSNKLTPKQTNPQTVTLYFGEQAVYTVTAPVMTDAAGALSDALTLQLVSAKNGKFQIKLTADSAWLNDPARVYPVTVDPTVLSKSGTASIQNKYLTSANSNLSASGSVYVGNQKNGMGVVRTAVKFSNLPALERGDMVCSARMYLEQRTYSHVNEPSQQIHAHEIAENWSGFSSSSPGIYTTANPKDTGKVLDYVITTASNNAKQIYWDITSTVKKWYNGGNNYGILLKPSDARWALVQLASSFHTVGFYPVLAIYYRNNRGLEDYWSYTEQDLGAGTGYVNDYSGNLVVNLPVCSTGSAANAAGLSLYYNGYQAGRHYAVWRGGSTYDPSKSICGAGWKTNFDETLGYLTKNVGNNNDLHAQGFEYVYTDADGTILYMKKKSGSTNVYEDELGKGLTLTLKNNIWYLDDKNGNQKVFNSGGKLTEIKSNESTSSVKLTYNANGFVSMVTDGSGNTLKFNRNKYNALVSVENYLGTTSLGFYGAKMTGLTYPDGTKSQIAYDSDNRLTTVTDCDGGQVKYEYNTVGDVANKNRVKKVTKYSSPDSGGNRQTGGSLSFDYNIGNYTTVTDHKGRKEVKSFDSFGHTQSTVGEDGAVSAAYTANNGTSAQNNKLTSTSANTLPVNNLLQNNSFENNLTGWGAFNSDNTTHAFSDSSNAYLGYKSVKLTNTAATVNSTFYQLYSAPETGQYTLSFYYKTTGLTGVGGLRPIISLLKKDGTVQYVNGTYRRESTNGEWQRMSLTANVDSTVVDRLHAVIAFQEAAGTAYVDAVQFEKSAAANEYNLVENGFLLRGGSSFVSNLQAGSSFNSTNGSAFSANCPAGITKGVFIRGNSGKNSNIHQDIQVNRPARQTAFQFSGYACGNSVPKNSGRYFALDICLNYDDGSYEFKVIDFCYDSTTWQYASGLIVPAEKHQNKKITFVSVYFLYYQNENWACFSGLNLSLDQTGTVYSYDSKGNLTSAKDMANRQELYSLDSANRLTQYTDSENSAYKFTYNTDNAAAGTTKYQVKTAEYAQYAQLYDFSYDKHGNITQTKQHNKNNTTATVMQSNATYSANGDRQLTATNELRNTTTYGYSATSAKDLRVYNVHNGNSTVYYGYLPGSNTVSKTSVKATGLNGTVQEHIASYAYQNNRLTGITHNGFNYTLGYDGFGNRTVTKVGSRTLVTNAYGANNGLLQSSTYGNGAKVENVYDRLDRVTAVKINGAEKYRYTYNANNQLAVFTDVALNKTTRYTYDLLGRLLRSDCSDGSVQQYTYNNVDNTTGKRYTYNGQTKSFGYTYQKGGIGETTTYPNGASRKQFLGHLAQVCKSTLTLPGGNTSTVEYGLYSPAEGFSSSAIGSVRYGQLNRSFVYSYTPQGNISAVTDGDRQSTYQYDEINQLIRENNAYLNKTVTYSYDAGGNILSKTTYPYTTGSLEGQTGETVTYSYGDSEWKDLLTAYNGQEITYDAIGNPLNYKNGFTFTWQNGRRLATAAANGKALSFAYNESGIRTQKTVDGVTTEYYLDGSTVLAQKTGNNTVWYYYDCNGTREALEYGGQVYYYLYNAQGDVMALYDNDLNIVTEYTYDSWGRVLSITGSLAETVGKANPFRYRGYYYDDETELYYLNSRYYDPETGRFINLDNQLSSNDPTGLNTFAYCGNNPINRADPTGEAWWHWALGAAIVAACAAATVITAGGFAAGMAAVAAVSSGVAASSVASTVAAGAFISSAMTFGASVAHAASTSKSLKQFNKKGNWGVVRSTAVSAALGGGSAYMSTRSSKTHSRSSQITSRGSTGRTRPTNLREQLAMEQVKSNPLAGSRLKSIELNDPRWPASEGWAKMQQIAPTSKGKISIHYVYNQALELFDDFKFKP